MSLARQFLHEWRPLVRMLNEPLRPTSLLSRSPSIFEEPFGISRFPFTREMMRAPAVDVSEAGNQYLVRAEVPGVKKENIEVRIGDNGRSLTIEGKLLSAEAPGTQVQANEATSAAAAEGERAADVVSANAADTAVATTENATKVIGSFSGSVSFPRPIDSGTVVAKLEDGILQITLNKAEDKASVLVPVA
ncbi:SHSP domain-containing protein [Mycena kentingensis (nom. inval.)]|nr:SHSP domain-containing protein [Mycena kentingensis (nom. inval.)]